MVTATNDSVAAIWQALREVMDPEIPTVSLVDLGVVTDVHVTDANEAFVTMTPTFVGCPAMEYMRASVEERLSMMGFAAVHVTMTFDKPWSSNSLTEEGRRGLAAFGLSAAEEYSGVLNLEVLNSMACPLCGGRNTELRSPFGPTLCRSIHFCRTCNQAFEAFKPV